MKKTLAAVAVLGAFAGSALAADVTLYGTVDMGLGYTHSDVDGVKTDNWGLKSGQNSMSRIGFKGTEQLTEDVTVGFVLENGFKADDGKLYDAFFHRQSSLFVKSSFGEIGVGRFGALDSTTGSYNLAGSRIHATTGVADVGDTEAIFLGQKSRMDNSIAYVSPEFAGFQVRAMASLGGMDGEEESTHKTERYYGLGVSYNAGAFGSALVVSQMDYADAWSDKGIDDALTVTAGVNYDFGVTKAFLAGQYFDNAQAGYTAAGWKANLEDGKFEAVEEEVNKGYKGYGVTLGAKTPVIGGTLTTQVGYMDAEEVADTARDLNAWNVGAIYEYPLSKRTSVYGALGYQYQEDVEKVETKTINAGFGLVHTF